MSAALHPFAIGGGFLSETLHWLDRALAATPSEPSEDRIRALYAAALVAGLQGNLPYTTMRTEEARSLAERMSDPVSHALVAIAGGVAALLNGDPDRALAEAEHALAANTDPALRMQATLMMGWALEFRGELGRALVWQEKALALTESAGDVVLRSYALWSVGIGWWRNRKPERAEQLLLKSLHLAHLVDDPRTGASCLEALAWIAGGRNDPMRAVVLMAAAAALCNSMGVSPAVLPDLVAFHDECESRARAQLSDANFDAAHQQGAAMDFGEAAAYAFDGEAVPSTA
jgi:non-specific serine/threonine protein kinase